MWLVIKDTVNINGKIFHSGVSWETWRTVGFSTNEHELWKEFNKNGENYVGLSWEEFKEIKRLGYELVVNGVPYVIDGDNAIMSSKMTYTDNISRADYISNKYHDKTKDYYKKTKEVLGIDMTLNHSPQYRDGVNPAKDKNDIE